MTSPLGNSDPAPVVAGLNRKAAAGIEPGSVGVVVRDGVCVADDDS